MGKLQEMVPRREWGAKYSPDVSIALSKRTEMLVHHTVIMVPNNDHSRCDDTIRAIELDHHKQWGFSVGYNLLECPHRVLYEGCGINKRGQHCPNHNTSAFGVAFLGDGRLQLPEGLVCDLHTIWDELSNLRGMRLYLNPHRKFRATNCPGDILAERTYAGLPCMVAPAPQPQPDPGNDPDDEYNLEAVMQNPVLAKGSGGGHVQIMQGLLCAHARDLAMYFSNNDIDKFVDGNFGANTEYVLAEWQRRTGVLVPDGVCGPKSWAWLCGLPNVA